MNMLWHKIGIVKHGLLTSGVYRIISYPHSEPLLDKFVSFILFLREPGEGRWGRELLNWDSSK